MFLARNNTTNQQFLTHYNVLMLLACNNTNQQFLTYYNVLMFGAAIILLTNSL